MVDVLTFTLVDPTDASALSTAIHLFDALRGMTVVGATIVPLEDDAGATVDIQSGGSDIITAIDASDADVPGTWKSTDLGGSNAPVRITAADKVEADMNNAAAGNAFQLTLWVKHDV